MQFFSFLLEKNKKIGKFIHDIENKKKINYDLLKLPDY